MMLVIFVLMLARQRGILVLRFREFGLAVHTLPLILVFADVIHAGAAYPAGLLQRRVHPRLCSSADLRCLRRHMGCSPSPRRGRWGSESGLGTAYGYDARTYSLPCCGCYAAPSLWHWVCRVLFGHGAAAFFGNAIAGFSADQFGLASSFLLSVANRRRLFTYVLVPRRSRVGR